MKIKAKNVLKYFVICFLSFVVIFLLFISFCFFMITNTGAGLYEKIVFTVKGDAPIPKENEIVMAPHTTIQATTDLGTISIESGKGLRRNYTWDGATRSVIMWPRKERWYGSLGLYYTGPGYHWKEHNGIRRGVVEEGQQHFASKEEAMEWIEKMKNWLFLVYTNDGLLVGFGKDLKRKQLSVELWQIYINDRKPTSLPGAKDEAIKVIE
ncbi:hypothetical protein ACFL1F_00075 [Chlamydiota bacterium]